MVKLFDLHCVLSSELFFEIRRAGNKVLPLQALGSTFAVIACAGWRDPEGQGETITHIILRAYQNRHMTEAEAIEILEPVLRRLPDAMFVKNIVGVTPTDIALQSLGKSAAQPNDPRTCETCARSAV